MKITRQGVSKVVMPVVLMAVALPAYGEQPEEVVGLWSGRQTVRGVRDLPVIGALDTRTDAWLLALIVRRDGLWRIEQTTCRVEIAEVAGVSVGFPTRTARLLGPVRIELAQGKDDVLHAAPWTSRLGEADLEGDGWPGVTLSVSAPLCSGKLAVASDTTTAAVVRRADERELTLDLKVRVAQRILATDGWCLSFAETSTTDDFTGTVRYEPLPEGASCAEVEALPPLDRALPPLDRAP